MQSIKLIGIGADGKANLPSLYERWIDESEVLIGGERHLEFFPDYQGEKVIIQGGLSSLVDRLRHETKRTVILASGDPMFYGIGSYLSSKIPIEVYPSVSSVQWAFAKMGEKWQDAYFVSLHGRSIKGLAQRIDGRETVAILTDYTNSPNEIAKYLLSYGMTEYRAFVGENLGGADERCRYFELEDMIQAEFSPLNVVVLKKTKNGPFWILGIDDEEFLQRKPEQGLITKKEIRVLSISALRLREDSVVWDIGTCTGSVAIEAAKIAREGAVFAIEKNAHDIEICKENLKKFRVDITLVHGKAPDHLHEFLEPDAIFIGGTSGEMGALLDVCCQRLKRNGRIVINAVTIETLSQAVEGLKQRGFYVDITLAQISRSKPILQLTRFASLNPIYIITAKREGDE
ncbi:precorrin-6y C5,15-methyltransferase (decarboxylating) subunit CbiE [Thermaerobacillus caldiproteolyticus]|uniref:Precorrin-6Y C5,15-methyltransferase (Decarboxylating) n=1 Tax=Thermaerobacillus caldiproteolyticus TaxID=247480 RepID=A0A7V9Z8H4_9BACL|nr:precorrin-6y C5,15-methyltransferase (decarboxylating) subunit CbiE [Anoxybacillus caldiproteolyticus]MBA2875911.1 precorrin-6Y C5,15-methyltransferase (decarboxylating) [Anoxybacillus caldiproteolyticus]QPA32445.1 precorrin-6y C5,15-methyltransferase (decarboxylating) subunit CbiE [Anoxybacillus caldiproteolyticus]